jgi:hypothetical protein
MSGKMRFDDILGEYADKPDDKSIMLYELEAFWEFSKDFIINRIVESGTYKGLTAKRLSLLYPDCKIYSFEKRLERFVDIPEENCSDNIIYKYGLLNRKILTSETAVIIDGPKRIEAVKLAYKCRKTVPFVAIHDMLEYENVLRSKFGRVYYRGQLAICV